MKIRKPEYYDEFVCIADKCSMTCCREWKIGVDDETNQKWKAFIPPKGVHPTRKNLSQYTEKKDGSRVIALNKKHLCPFLDDQKLCRLVCTYGDDILSETCRVFPREIHTFSDQKEFFLMPSCPAVIDLIKKYPECTYIEDIKESESTEEAKTQEPKLNLLRNERSIFVKWMQRKVYQPEENLKHIFFAALELYRILQEEQEKISETVHNRAVFSCERIVTSLEEYNSKRLQDELATAVNQIPADHEAAFIEQNQLFLDLTANYEREGLYQKELATALKTASQLENIEEEIALSDLLKQKRAFDHEFLNWQELMRSFLTAEIESDCLLPDGTMQDFLVHLEWIALEYATIKHFLFLDWLENGSLTYERVRSAIVLICRMTGYEEDDIYEYLEDSFEDVIWEWGYLALILN